MSRSLPRHIAPSSVEVGDTISVTIQRGDVKETSTAEVDRVVRTSSTVMFISPEGHTFGTFRYGSKARVLLTGRKVSYEQEPLFDMDERIA